MLIFLTSIPLWDDQEAATGIEYALLGALIAAAIATTVGDLGDAVLGLWSTASTKIVLAIDAALN